MNRKKYFGIMTAAAMGIVTVQMPVYAAPVDDLEEILEQQFDKEEDKLLENLLGLEQLDDAMEESGAQIRTNLVLTDEMIDLMGESLPEAFRDKLNLASNIQEDRKQKQWRFDLSAGAGGTDFANMSLYGDKDMLSLEVPQLLSYGLGLRSGSFLEQYQGSVWEQMMGEMDASNDVELDFFPDEKESEETDYMKLLQETFEDGLEEIQDSVKVETREEGAVTLYDATYDTETVIRLYGDLVKESMDIMRQIPGAEVTGMENFTEELNDSIEEAKAFLGDEVVLTYHVENDLVTEVTAHLDAKESWRGSDSAEDTEAAGETETETEEAKDPNTVIGALDISVVFANPEEPMETVNATITAEDFESSSTAVIECSLVNEKTDSSRDTSFTVKAVQGDETMFAGEVYHGSFDAATGEWAFKIMMDQDEETTQSLSGSGKFENIEKGRSFTVTLDDLSLTISGFSLPMVTGTVDVSADPGTIEVPADVKMLADITEDEIADMATEVMMNAQSWADEMGLFPELETEAEAQ